MGLLAGVTCRRRLPPTQRADFLLIRLVTATMCIEVEKQIPVEGSIVAPAFGEPGKGTQFLLDKPVSWYVSNGYLKEVH